jgi:3-oxoacyl-[acyl-carrier protein] reductase
MKILISGASRGLGLDLADYLSERGHQVTTFARSEHVTDKFRHIPGIDVTQDEHLFSLGPILAESDVLINNVGMAYDGILATQGIDNIKKMIDTNLTSVIILTKLWIRNRMQVRKLGSCVSISSIISERGFSGLSTYAATKAGLDALTRSLAREMGPKGFRFNSVQPGYFESDLSKSLDDKKKQQIIRRTPLGRLATTSDICPLIDFLASDGSRFITGQSIMVDGGLTT